MPRLSSRYITTLLVMLATTGSQSQLLTTVQTVIGSGDSAAMALVMGEENSVADILSVVNLLKIAKKQASLHFFKADDHATPTESCTQTGIAAKSEQNALRHIMQKKRKAISRNVHIRAPNC